MARRAAGVLVGSVALLVPYLRGWAVHLRSSS